MTDKEEVVISGWHPSMSLENLLTERAKLSQQILRDHDRDEILRDVIQRLQALPQQTDGTRMLAQDLYADHTLITKRGLEAIELVTNLERVIREVEANPAGPTFRVMTTEDDPRQS